MQTTFNVFLIGLAVGAAVFLGTRILIKEKADYMIGGAVVIAFFALPWWASLAGALVGHALALIVTRKLTKKSIPPEFKVLAVAAFCAYYGVFVYNFNAVTRDVISIHQNDLESAWVDFKIKSPAHDFVFVNYKPCIEAKSHTRLSTNAKHDPSVCRSSAVSLASAIKGQTFAEAVNTSITEWSAIKKSTPESDAKLAELMASI